MLMSNHFHLVAVGDRQDAISRFMREVNGQYATYRIATQRATGGVWQNRFYSCVLDDSHWETALRYVELNPVRARLVKAAEDYRSPSAQAHLGLDTPPEWLDKDHFLCRWPTPGRRRLRQRWAIRGDTTKGNAENARAWNCLNYLTP